MNKPSEVIQEQPVETNTAERVEPKHAPESGVPLSFLAILLDTVKGTKLALDPLSDCIGGTLGVICCCAVCLINDHENKKKTATRYDVVHAEQIRKNEADQENMGYQCGFFIGNAVVDTLSSIMGGTIIGMPRAAYLSWTRNNDRANNVLGFTRERIEGVDLFESCRYCS